MTAPRKLSWLDDLWAHEATEPLVEAGTGTLDNVASTRETDRAVSRLDAEDASSIRFTGAAPSVTGIAGGWPGRRIQVIASGGDLTLEDEAGSDAANRLDCGGTDAAIGQGTAAWLVYDDSRWHLSGGGVGGIGTPGGAVGEAQFHDTGAVLDGTPNLKIDPTTKEVSFASNELIHYQGTYGGTDAIPFDAIVTNGTEPAILCSFPVLAADHEGTLDVSALAHWSGGRSKQVWTVGYTYVGGTLTLDTPDDLTPSGRADPLGVLTFATHDSGGVDYVDVKGSASGDTHWVGQAQLIMAETP